MFAAVGFAKGKGAVEAFDAVWKGDEAALRAGAVVAVEAWLAGVPKPPNAVDWGTGLAGFPNTDGADGAPNPVEAACANGFFDAAAAAAAAKGFAACVKEDVVEVAASVSDSES